MDGLWRITICFFVLKVFSLNYAFTTTDYGGLTTF